MSINERFIKIINELYSGKKSAFSKAIGVSPTVIENIVGRRHGNPSFEVTQKVLYANANIDARWLMTGEGKMEIIPSGLQTEDVQITEDNDLHESAVEYEKNYKDKYIEKLESDIIRLQNQVDILQTNNEEKQSIINSFLSGEIVIMKNEKK